MNEVERAKKRAEAAKALEKADREIKRCSSYLDSDYTSNSNMDKSARDLKFAAEKRAQAQKNLDRLK